VTVEDLVMVQRNRHSSAAGRHHARRLLCLAAAIVMAGRLAAADPARGPRLEVTETGGVYNVTATFAVTESPEAVIAVLTDYERIPRYMPDMEVSRILERTPDGVLVEQQAISKFMMFVKRVHLVLEVRELGGAVKFRDRCGRSFAVYDGEWLISQHDGLTVVDYQLSAKPSFDVPGFMLKRLLKRDAGQLIDRIKIEIAARAARRP
jgi:hypothetical protein